MDVVQRTIYICARYRHNAYIFNAQYFACLDPAGCRSQMHCQLSGFELGTVCIHICKYIRGGVTVINELLPAFQKVFYIVAGVLNGGAVFFEDSACHTI